MRDISMIAVTALITAIMTIWSMHAVGTGTPQRSTAASASMNIMQMMRDTKNLPEQRYDAF
jgi:hypothetical protein